MSGLTPSSPGGDGGSGGSGCSSVNSKVGDGDWRRVRPGVRGKLTYILETREFTDVTFIVGGPSSSSRETIKAHRLVLSLYSGVFEAMFQGPLAASPAEIIEIPDIEPSAFHILLKFMYKGEFDKTLSTDNAIAVLYAAKKYDVNDLELVCSDHLKSLLGLDNAVSVFQTSQLLDLELSDLKNEAFSYLARHFEAISGTEDFLSITLSNLVTLLSDDDTHGEELQLFFAVKRWTEAECTRRNMEPTPSNCRSVGLDALMAVRFPIVTLEDFAMQVIPTGLISTEEATLLFQHMVVSVENRSLLPPLTFTSKKRNCSVYIAKFYDGMAKTAYVDISAGWYNKFSVTQAVSIVSFGFYGPHSTEIGSYKVIIKLIRDSDEEVLGEARDDELVAKMKEIFHLKFPKPITICPGHTYRAWFSVKGPLTCHGSSSRSGQEIVIPVNYTKYSNVKFFYNITGAHQLPEIAFEI